MKRLYYLLSLVALIAIGGGLTACTDPVEEIGPDEIVSINYALDATGITSAEVIVTSNGVDEVGYVVTKNEVAPGAPVVFMTGEIVPITSSEMTINVRDLEVNSTQWVHFAPRWTNDKGEAIIGEVTSIEVTTYDYQELITVLETSEQGVIKFHVNCPEGRKVVVGVQSRENYATMRGFGQTDASALINFYGQPMGELITEPTTIEFDGEIWDEETQSMLKQYAMAPGEAFVIIAGEVEEVEGGVENWNGQIIPGYRVMFDMEGYAEWFANSGGGGIAPASAPIHGDDGSEDERPFWEEGALHQTVYTNVTRPLESALPLEYEVTTLTTQRATFEVKPSDYTIVFYVCTPMRDWENMADVLGEENIQAWITTNAQYFAGDQGATLPAVDLEKDMTYRMVFVGLEDAEGTRQKMIIHDFQVAEPTKPAPVMEVRAAQASEIGYEEHPNVVWFNVRSTSKDVTSLKYVCNSPNEFFKLFNTIDYMMDDMGYPIFDENGEPITYYPYQTYADIVNAYGTNYGITSDFIEQVNTDQGAYFSTGSFANAETTLVFVGYNDEDFGGEAAYATARTIDYPAEAPVNSELFEKLVGKWTIKYTNIEGTDVEFKTEITDGSIHVGELSEVTPLYTDPADAEKYYNEFITAAERYEQTIKNRNLLLCEGYNLQGYNFYWDMTFYSPWDLLVSPGSRYNGYSIDDLFLDFGPKWFLKVGEGNKLTMPVNDSWEMVANCNGSTTFYQSAAYFNSSEDYGFNTAITGFDVAVSDDYNTMTIKGVKDDQGNMVYPILYHLTYGSSLTITTPSFPATDLVMTRGWSEENVRPKSVGQKPVIAPSASGINHRFHKTPFYGKNVRPIEVLNWEHVVAKYTK